MISAGALVTAVGAILVFGWVRQTDPRPVEPAAPARRSPVVALPPPPTAETPPPAIAPEMLAPGPEAPPPPNDPLAARAERDAERLAGSAGGWTLQLLVACREETATRLLERAGRTDRIFVLPVELDGRPCYRLSWGIYASREEAASARDLPPSLRAVSPSATPRPLQGLAP